MKRITITLNPAQDRTLYLEQFKLHRTNRARKVMTQVGGKGINVSNTLEAFGYDSLAIVLLAGESGEQIQRDLDGHRYGCSTVWIDGSSRLNLKIMDESEQAMTEVNDVSPVITMSQFQDLWAILEESVEAGDIVMLCGSAPQGLPPSFYGEIAEFVRLRHATLILDADGENFRAGLEGIPAVIKPNAEECQAYRGSDVPLNEADYRSLIQEWLMSGIRYCVVSLGARGALFGSEQGIVSMPGLKVDVVSTTGAGDSMVAALAIGLSEGLDNLELYRLAMAVSGATVETAGTQPARRSRVIELMKEMNVEGRGGWYEN